MISYLMKRGGYNTNGLTTEEKAELERLRNEIKDYRNEWDYKENILTSDEDDDDKDDQMEDIISNTNIYSKKDKRQRKGVSAECFNNNDTKNIKLKFIKKTNEQVQRIKLKIIKSFLFDNLDHKEMNIIIGAMEEHKVRYITCLNQ